MSYEIKQRFFGDWSRIEPKNSQEEIVLAVLKQGEVSWKKFDPFEEVEDASEIISRFAVSTNQDIVEEFSADYLVGWNTTTYHSNGEVSVEKEAKQVEFIF